MELAVGEKVTVIIVNWNNRILLSECLQGLKTQSYSHFSILVVDNGSKDDSVEFLLKYHPDIHLIALTKNEGFAIANNIAVQSIDTVFFALLNNDAVPHPDWLKNLVSVMEACPESGFVASKMLFHHDPNLIDRTGDAYTLAGTGWLRGRGKKSSCIQNKEWVFGACAGAALYRSDMFRKLGGFDEDFFLLYEDVDLSFRAQLQGYRCVFEPKAIVYHRSSASIGHDSQTSIYYSHRNLEWTYLKNMPANLLAITFLPHLLYVVCSALYFVLSGHGRIFFKAKMDACLGLKKMLQKRRRVQSQKKVPDAYIYSLLEKELFFNRLLRRLKN